MKHLLTLLLCLTVFSFCQAQSQLGDDKTFRKCFTTEEIADLQKLFDFFNANICLDDKNENLDTCYQRFFRRMSTAPDLGTIDIQIDFKKQQKTYDNISKSLFHEIWSYGRARNPQTGHEWQTIYFNGSGKYMHFMKAVGRTDKVIKQYQEAAEACGDVCPTMVAGLVLNYSYYNTEDIRVKFIIAIHYLTLNDHFEEEKENTNPNTR